MMQWLQRMFGPSGSSATAKERLRLVLLTDHLSLAPDVVDALKRDLLAVISRYVEVDESHADVSFERQDSAIAMLANVPILKLRERPLPPDGGPGSGRRAEPVVAPAPEPPAMLSPSAAMPAPSAAAPEPKEPAIEPAAEVAAESEQLPAGAETPPAPARRRRRRRRTAATRNTTGGEGADPAHATG